MGCRKRILLRKKPVRNCWYTVKFVGTVSITLTGMVFSFVLAPAMGGAAWTLPNILAHVVVPICSAMDFVVTGVSGQIPGIHSLRVAVPFIACAVYAGIGYTRGREFAPGINDPCFFLNRGSPAGAFVFLPELLFMGCMWRILVLLVLLLLCGAFYFRILNLCRKGTLRRAEKGAEHE